MSSDFSPEQKRYLEGFVSGLQSMQAALDAGVAGQGATSSVPTGPDAIHLAAQDRAVAAGGKLVDQEKWKRAEHPFEAYARFKAQAKAGTYPKPEDNFRWRYYGLFYVAPAQNSYMCRIRVPGGILKSYQLEGVADIADAHGGGFAHVTTRAGLQVREITAEHAPAVVEGLVDLGLTARGAGADNIRNVTGSATAGIDRQELIDTRSYAHEWHHHVLNDRTLYGLPRKFNVSFDGGGCIATLEDTNDIGFQAVQVLDGASVAPGLYFRLVLGGISGHKDLARDTGVVLPLDEATQVADAIVRVFIENGNRTDRNRSRLKYVLDAWGFEKFLGAVEDRLGRVLARVSDAHVAPRPAHDRLGHLGVHSQKQAGLNWIGVWTPLGKMLSSQMRAVAKIARDFGDGDVRLTVWQNLLLSGVKDADVEAAKAAIAAAGFAVDVSNVRAGLVACTGSKGCKFAAADTKGDALNIADHLDATLVVDQPVNIHVTGCHNSCAQHYIGDIGLIGQKVSVNDEGDTVEGYNIQVGGGFGVQGAIASLIYPDVKAVDAPFVIERLLRAYMAQRADTTESFHGYVVRVGVEAVKAQAEGRAS